MLDKEAFANGFGFCTCVRVVMPSLILGYPCCPGSGTTTKVPFACLPGGGERGWDNTESYSYVPFERQAEL